VLDAAGGRVDRVALKGISGSLLSAAVVEGLAGATESPHALRTILRTAACRLGPASPARHVLDTLAEPLFRDLGLDVRVIQESATAIIGTVGSGGAAFADVSIGGWNADLGRLRHAAARLTTDRRPRWWIGINGAALRILDASRAYARRAVDLDLACVADDDRAIRVLRRLFDAGGGLFATLDDLVRLSEQHRSVVGRSLQTGVEQALTALIEGFGKRRRGTVPSRDLDAALSDALTIVYRILFLLFAEARGLVPAWHPVYRDSYTIESLRPQAESRGSPAGLWQALQAIARLAHRGCSAGTLTVVPFNGRLFAPASAPLAETFTLDDRLVRDVLLAVTTRPGVDRRERISYADLGVEQLGAVYERVLDFPASAPSPPGTALRRGKPAVTRGKRKATGTFYTPRSITEYLARRTLAPLVRGRTPEALLALRIVDPAMGSGAFLVAACRYLAAAYEDSLILEGSLARTDVTPADRASFRRLVAQRCLYGVDLNPMAVQLARLSLWLCTLAADRPLTFLDHHLCCGNSLAGARMHDIQRQPPAGGRRAAAALPLFEPDALLSSLASAIGPRMEMALTPDDTVTAVRHKERIVDSLQGARGPLAIWRELADAWCAAWFWPRDIPAVPPRAWPALSARIRGAGEDLPERIARAWRDTSADVARRHRFFHWELEFPEVFFDGRGAPLAGGGFDAVVGNPPWAAASALTAFSRASGCYTLQGDGHANLYQLFAERMLQLGRSDGRVGMLMPSGLAGDQGSAALRRHLFDRCRVDALLSFDNRDALFPIHRGMRFALITATSGGSTTDLRSRSGLHDASDLDDVPDDGDVPGCVAIPMTLVRRFSGPALAIPDLICERDRSILARVLATVPSFDDDRGWGAHVGRELNATDDREHFQPHGLPVVEGKHIEPFRLHVESAGCFIDRRVAARLLGSRIERPRLGYREVAAATNRLTLIAAVIPARVVTTHTIFCVRELSGGGEADASPEDVHWFLCGMFNSFVANYLVRLRGGTHLPAAVIHRLPVPRPSPGSHAFTAVVRLAREASRPESDGAARVRLHARAARLYGLDRDDLLHVLGTFPLVPIEERDAVLSAFSSGTDEVYS